MSDKTFKLEWEAIHDDSDAFGGVWFDAPRGDAFLFYPGSAIRKGMFAWQRNELESPVEVHAVAFREDEVRWSTELTGGERLEGVAPDQIYNALAVRPLRVSPSRVMGALRLDWDRWVVFGLDRETGECVWEHPSLEPRRAHQSPDGSRIIVAGSERFEWIDTASGEVIGGVAGEVTDCVAAVVGGAGALVQTADGNVCFLGTDGGERWQSEVGFPLDADGLSARVRVDDEAVWIADVSDLRCIDGATGAERWRIAGAGGGHVALADVGPAVVVQELATNSVRLISAAEGREITAEGFARMMHWIPDGDALVGPSHDGAFCRLDLASGDFSEAPVPEGLLLHDVSVHQGRVFATGRPVEDEEGSCLVELSADGSETIASVDLPFALPLILTIEGGLVILRSALGAVIYAPPS